VVTHQAEVKNMLELRSASLSDYVLEIDHDPYDQLVDLDDNPHILKFFVETMTPESSIEHGLLNDNEVMLLDLATSLFLILLPRPVGTYSNPEEVIGYPEGATAQVLVNRFERDPRNRAAAIAVHGTKCLACGFDFKQIYGDLGRDFIIVHHVVPVSQIGPGYLIDPARDLVTLCANCHAMIHRSNPPLSLIQLRGIVQGR